jgi:protease I
MTHLTGKTVAFLLTDGFEDVELTEPWKAVTEHGAQAVLVSPKAGEVEGKKGHRQRSTGRSPMLCRSSSTRSCCRAAW